LKRRVFCGSDIFNHENENLGPGKFQGQLFFRSRRCRLLPSGSTKQGNALHIDLVDDRSLHRKRYAVKGDIRVAMEMYASIKSSGAASAALNTAVRMGLEPKYAKVRKVPTGDNALISYRKEMSVAEQPRGIRIKARGGFEA
jgi:hypothetical protein